MSSVYKINTSRKLYPGFFFFFLLCWVFVVVDGLSLVAESKGYSLLWCYGLLIAVAFLVAEHRL